MTEFEKSLERLLALVIVGNYSVEESKTLIPSWSKTLIDKVRKQIVSEIDVDAMVKKRITVKSAYRKGIEDTLKAIKEG